MLWQIWLRNVWDILNNIFDKIFMSKNITTKYEFYFKKIFAIYYAIYYLV